MPRVVASTRNDRRRTPIVPWSLALLVLVAASVRTAGASPQAPSGGAAEVFETTDPYTKGESAALDKAGYVSFGPFPLADGIHTRDLEELLGGVRILWVETDHFRLGSTLPTYRYHADQREERKLEAELARLAKKLPRARTARKLDPWLRLHLYAQRLEEQYAAFEERFGFSDRDFVVAEPRPVPGAAGYMGEGPYLGQPLKFSVLLFEKSSMLARFLHGVLRREDAAPVYRHALAGGSMFVGTCAEAWEGFGYELDATLHCVVAANLAHNFLDAFRDNRMTVPTWLAEGFAHAESRRADERFTVGAEGTTKEFGDDSWRWQPRVRALVNNRFARPWTEMLAWKDRKELESLDHLVVWSRVDWLLAREPADLRAFVTALTDRVPSGAAADAGAHVERQVRALAAGFGKTPEELDEAWRRHVLGRYPKD